MHTLDAQLEKIKQANRLGLMTHVVAGFPDLGVTRELINLMSNGGTDFIEVQIPFSDPMGDGEAIREACATALSNGARVEDVFEMLKKVRDEDRITVPILIMTYFNIVHAYGIEKFCSRAAALGVCGLIIPDYPDAAESVEHLESIASKHSLVTIKFLSLDSAVDKIKSVGSSARGFVYCFAKRGVTGSSSDTSNELVGHLARIKQSVKQPLAVGFGISTGEHVRALKNQADIVIVGSAFIRAFEQGGVEQVRNKLREIIAAL